MHFVREKPDRGGLALNSSNSKTNVANGFSAEALLKLAQNLRFRDAFEFVMQRRLEDADVEDAFAQCNRCGMGGDEFADDRGPGVDYFAFAQALFKAELLHQLRQQQAGCFPLIWPRLFLRQTSPFLDDGGAKRRGHERVNVKIGTTLKRVPDLTM